MVRGKNFNSSYNFLLKNKFKLVKKFKFPLMNFEDRLYLSTSFKKNDTFNNDLIKGFN
mgnify:FL=1